LFCGCYYYSSLAKDEPVPNDKDARFQLKDGRLLEAGAGHHSRIEGGYQVSGTIVKEDTLRLTSVEGIRKTVIPFTGVVRDADIEEISTYQRNTTGPVLLVATTVLVVGIVVAITFPKIW
jgi:hypothetical protein